LRIVLGITGGIAAYKAIEVLRLLLKAGHSLETVATPNALKFVGAASLEALSGKKIHSELFEDAASVPHVQLAKTDLVLVAPATASFLARYAAGLADDLLLNVLLATTARVIVAPAMHTEMWQHPATQQNLQTLRVRGVEIVEPAVGELTSGDIGVGRLARVEDILSAVDSIPLARPGKGFKAVVTAGGTREPIDEVRYVGNASTGKQGIALAAALSGQGYSVTLIGANMDDPKLASVAFRSVETHEDLALALEANPCDILFMAAAVSDFKAKPIAGKLRRSQTFALELTPTLDLVAAYKREHPSRKVIAFAAEPLFADDLLSAAREKLGKKGVDAVIANPISAIGSDSNQGYVVVADGEVPFQGTKAQVSDQIISALFHLNVLPKN
jgi:phosphopantothenoylcysteine decarboxylase/phosphopantothenate--cysteine ligase